MTPRLSASLAAAPLDYLAQTIAELETAGADMIHFDVEDGTFAPVMTLGTKIIHDLRPLTRLPFDVHLMMVNPEWILPQLAADGANRVSVHYEACPYPRRTLRQIASLGVSAGLAFNPATPLPDLAYLLPYLKFVVILTSEPEIPDSPFLPHILSKLAQGKRQPGLETVEWVVDGGISLETSQYLAGFGIDMVVVGRALFRDGKLPGNLQALRSSLGSGEVSSSGA